MGKKSSFLCVLMLVGMVTVFSSPASHAQETPVSPVSATTEFPATLDSVSQLEGYVETTPTGYVLDAPDSVIKHVDPEALSSLESYWAQVRQDIASGSLIYADGQYVERSSLAKSSSHGFIKRKWYGYQIGMDSWLVTKIEGGLGTAAVAAALGGGAAATPIAAALGGSAAMLQVCTHKNGWVYIYWVGGVPPTGGLVCNPFG